MSTVNASADDLVEVFNTFGPAYWKWMTAGARDSGVTFPRLRLLATLDADGAQIMSSLRDRLGITARSVTALVDGLEQDGLVRRSAHATDRRATVVELTGAGREIVERAFSAHRARAVELFRRLEPSDQAELHRLMSALTTALRDLAADEGSPLRIPHC